MLWEKVIELQQTRNAGKKEGKLLLDSLRILSELPISPAKNAPAIVNQAVLTEKIVFVGMSQKFQIWDSERFALVDAERIARIKANREREIAKLSGGGQ